MNIKRANCDIAKAYRLQLKKETKRNTKRNNTACSGSVRIHHKRHGPNTTSKDKFMFKETTGRIRKRN